MIVASRPKFMHFLFAGLLAVFAFALLNYCLGQEADEWEPSSISSNASLKIQSRVDSGTWKSSHVSINRDQKIELRVLKPEGADEIRWFQIVADVSKYYKNANHPWEKDPYKWVGFDEIDYEVREITKWRDKWQVPQVEPDDFSLINPPKFYHNDVGTFWIQAEVRIGKKRLRSAGLKERTSRGMALSVFRLTIRENDSYLGHLTGFFNVPGLFGSIPYQSNNYIGVDCADVLVAARRKWRGRDDDRDYNVAMLVSEWPKAVNFQLKQGRVVEGNIGWGDQVKPGDLIAVRYPGRSRYQHIGALYRDQNANGVLDPEDIVLHAGPEALHFTALGNGGFDGEVAILRPKK